MIGPFVTRSPQINDTRLLKRSQITIKMPKKFMRDTSDEEKTIMILLAARKFKYTRVAVLPEYQIDFPKRYWEMVEIVSMPEFKFYINGKYTPPI